MASADGDQQEPGGSQLAVPDGPQVPGGGQDMPQYAFENNNTFPDDGGQQEPGESQLAVPDAPQVPGGGQQMPEHLTIGTKKAFENNYPFRT